MQDIEIILFTGSAENDRIISWPFHKNELGSDLSSDTIIPDELNYAGILQCQGSVCLPIAGGIPPGVSHHREFHIHDVPGRRRLPNGHVQYPLADRFIPEPSAAPAEEQKVVQVGAADAGIGKLHVGNEDIRRTREGDCSFGTDHNAVLAV